MDVFFTEQFLSYLADKYGTCIDKLYLADQDELIVTDGDSDQSLISVDGSNPSVISVLNNQAIVGSNTGLIDKVEVDLKENISIFKPSPSQPGSSGFSTEGSIKKTNKKWKNKIPVITGTYPNGFNSSFPSLIYGEDREQIIQDAKEYELQTGSQVNFGTAPFPFFAQKYPTNDLFDSVCSEFLLNSTSTELKLYMYRGSPQFSMDGEGNGSWWSSPDIFQMAVTDVAIFDYNGTNTDITPNTGPSVINNTSGVGFLDSNTGLVYYTFPEYSFGTTQSANIDGFFWAKTSLKKEEEQLPEDAPLVIFACHERISVTEVPVPQPPPRQPGYTQDTTPSGTAGYNVIKTPKITLGFEIVII